MPLTALGFFSSLGVSLRNLAEFLFLQEVLRSKAIPSWIVFQNLTRCQLSRANNLSDLLEAFSSQIGLSRLALFSILGLCSILLNS